MSGEFSHKSRGAIGCPGGFLGQGGDKNEDVEAVTFRKRATTPHLVDFSCHLEMNDSFEGLFECGSLCDS